MRGRPLRGLSRGARGAPWTAPDDAASSASGPRSAEPVPADPVDLADLGESVEASVEEPEAQPDDVRLAGRQRLQLGRDHAATLGVEGQLAGVVGVHVGEQVPEGDGAGAVDGLVEDSTGRACSRSCPTTSASVWWSAPISSMQAPRSTSSAAVSNGIRAMQLR